MTNVLTVTLNPALDMPTSVDAVVAEEKLRWAVPLFNRVAGEPGFCWRCVIAAVFRDMGLSCRSRNETGFWRPSGA